MKSLVMFPVFTQPSFFLNAAVVLERFAVAPFQSAAPLQFVLVPYDTRSTIPTPLGQATGPGATPGPVRITLPEVPDRFGAAADASAVGSGAPTLALLAS